jgi:hypothetical protein
MRAAFFVILALLMAPVFPALAQPRGQGVMPLDQILSEIRRSHPGKFYDADGPNPGPDGQQHYHLKWMTPVGRIEWLDTDARTGRVLNSAPGRDSFDAGGPPAYPQAPSYPVPQSRGRFGNGDNQGGPADRGNRRDFRNDDGPGWGGGYFPGGFSRGRGNSQGGGFSRGGGQDYGAGRFEGRENGRGRGRGRGRER